MSKNPATVSIKVEGVKQLSRDALKFGVQLSDLKKLTYKLAKPIQAKARELAPTKTGRLRTGIKPVRSKQSISVAVGGNSLPYAGVIHWGRDGKSGPMFLSVAEETLRPQTLTQFDQGIHELLRQAGWL